MPTSEEFSETYRDFPDEEIAALYAQIDTLTESAHTALAAEIQRRGLSDALLKKLLSDEHRHEAQFDRLEKLRRKKLAWGDLPRNLNEWIFVIAGGFLLVLIERLASCHRH